MLHQMNFGAVINALYRRQDRADSIPDCKTEELEEGWQTYILKWLMFKLTGLRVHFPQSKL